MQLNVAYRVANTQAEGPGHRYALWVQGCPLRCPGCCNQEMLPFVEAEQISANAILAEVAEVADQIEGVTFLGGEPFAQAEGLAVLAKGVQQLELSVMVFSGFTLEQIHRGNPHWKDLLNQIDLLVDGPYLQDLATLDRRWIGSTNQRIHFLTDRYRHLQESETGWDTGKNTIELRWENGELRVNGFPHEDIRLGDSKT